MTHAPRRPIRIANCSGFFGDRQSAAREMVHGGPIDVLSGDWLAELTLYILSKTRARGGRGYAATFLAQLEEVLGTCLERGIKIVANAGGLHPRGCAEAVAELGTRLGLAPTVAYVSGDDLLAGGELRHEVRSFDDRPIEGLDRLVTANAYLGGWGVTRALDRGADVVVTGRVTDAALISGPAAWWHRWAREDWDALAGAVVAGHVIECGTQATGGNYSRFREVPDLHRAGFPWAEIAADGSSIIGKHDGTGGLVSVGTVTSQLLYEIDAPAYLGPDVTSHFDSINIAQAGTNRVAISGVRGSAPPPTLKVALNFDGGLRTTIEIAVTGLEIEAKVERVRTAFWAAYPFAPETLDRVHEEVLRRDRPDPRTNDEATAVWRLTVQDRDEHKVGRVLSSTAIEMALSSIPGFYLLGGAPPKSRAFGVYRSALVAADTVAHTVTILGSEAATIAPTPGRSVPRPDDPEPARPPVAEATRKVPLGRIASTRSGDKGANANLGVFAENDEVWEWLEAYLTVSELQRLLPESAALPVRRYRLANLRALNFVIEGLLDEGVAAATRSDAQAKSLGEWLRACVVAVPERLLDHERVEGGTPR